jgi:hypothetical protein
MGDEADTDEFREQVEALAEAGHDLMRQRHG